MLPPSELRAPATIMHGSTCSTHVARRPARDVRAKFARSSLFTHSSVAMNFSPLGDAERSPSRATDTTTAAASRNVKYAQNLDAVSPHPVRNDVPSPWNDEFPRSGNPARTTEPWLLGEVTHGTHDAPDYKTSSGSIIFSDVGSFGIEICESRAQPSNAHSASTCARTSQRPCHPRNRPRRLP
jgi:hypothetical protein